MSCVMQTSCALHGKTWKDQIQTIKISEKHWYFTNCHLTSFEFLQLGNWLSSYSALCTHCKCKLRPKVFRNKECTTLTSKRRKPQKDKTSHHYKGELVFKMHCRTSWILILLVKIMEKNLLGLHPTTPLPKSYTSILGLIWGWLKTLSYSFLCCWLKFSLLERVAQLNDPYLAPDCSKASAYCSTTTI